MYNDGGVTDNLWTGYYDPQTHEYVYPDAQQNCVIAFENFYLSAADGDFADSGVTITSETGEAEDLTVGNATARVLTATMLDPDGKMKDLSWGDGTVYIGVAAAAAADEYQDYPAHIIAGTTHYGIDANGVPRKDDAALGTLGGIPAAVISNSAGTEVLFITDTAIGKLQGNSYELVTSPSPAEAFYAAKYRLMPQAIGVLTDANGCPFEYNNVAQGTKETYSYIPMGTFDFSGVDTFGVAFGVEAYDKMIAFDADCTSWWNAVDFDNNGSGRTLSALAGMLCTQFGFTGSPSIDPAAVNDSVVWRTNPITSYAVTGRDILRWLAEAMGCNVRMSRDGAVEFWAFHSSPVATVRPDTIVGNTRVKGKATVPAVTEVLCYNMLGASFKSGSSGSTYYIVANPFLDPSADNTPLVNLGNLLAAIPAYYPATITAAFSDPRWDAGDFISVGTTDGTLPFAIPVMQESLHWNGRCTAVLSASGRQVRAIPEGMTNTDLSSMVDSNPSAVVNKIEAHGISADWITSGTIDASVINVENVTAEKVEVKDSNDNTIFSANANTKQIYINAYNEDGNSVFTLDGTGPFQSVEIGDWVAEDTSLYSEAQSAGHTIHGELNPVYVDFTDVDSGNEATLSHNGLEVTKYSSAFPIYTQYAGDGFTVHDDNSGTSCKMSVIKRTMDSAGTTTITLERGVYLAIVTHTNNTTAGQQGLYVIQAYDSNSVVLPITAAANCTLTISGLTLTWTTTNTYRALRLIHLS